MSRRATSGESAHLALMLERAIDGLCLIAPDGMILATTPAIERMLGARPGALVGTNGLDWLHPDDLDLALHAMAGIEEDGDFHGYRFRRLDGSYITVEVLSTPADASPDLAPASALVLTVREVTEYHEARLELDRRRVRRELLARIAARFVDALDADIDRAVDGAVHDLAAHAGADRGYVFRLSADGSTMRRTHGWAAPPHSFANTPGIEIPTARFPAWRSLVLHQRPIVVDDTTTMDPGWTHEGASMAELELGALLAVPMLREGATVGFLGLDVQGRTSPWSPDDVELLRVSSDVIGSALARRDEAERSRAVAARFRALVENSSDALIVVDRDAAISHRPLGRELFGYAPDDLVGVNALDLVHPDDLEFAAAEMLRAISDPSYQATNSMRIRHADGHWVPIELVARSHFDDPDIDGIVMNVRDHTEREAFASALRSSEARHRSLVVNLPGAVYRCRATPPYTDEFVSDAIEDLTGYPASVFLDGSIVFDDLILAEHRQRTDDELDAAVAAGEAFVIEYPIRHRDGSVRWLSEHGRLITGDHGPGHLEGFIFDITSRVDAEIEGHETELQLANLIDNVPGAVFRCEARPPYRDVFLSDAIEDLTGYAVEAFGRDLEYYDLILPHHRERMDAIIRVQSEASAPYRVEYEIVHRDGSRRWIEERGQANRTPGDHRLFLDGVMMDLTDRKALEERLAHDAAHDPLTGLPNRTLLLDHLGSTLARDERAGSRTAVLFVDLDRFKLVNDAMGHTAGDELLVHFTRRLTSVLRDSDLAARTGGDEFVVVCADLEAAEEAQAIAGRIANVLRDPFMIQGRPVFVTASVGIAVAQTAASAADVLRSADAAAYRAKDRGRNRFEVFDDALRAATTAALEVETDLHRALEEHQLFLRYQPVVELASGGLLGAEALVRWAHPGRGLLNPDAFLPAAEASGLIVALGREMLDLATGALATVPVDALPVVSVNLSPRELAQPDLVGHLSRVLDARAIDPRRLCIEITENAVLDEVDDTFATLESIRALGIRLAIDDFGTGYSSLSYLRRLPVDTVKIDRSFTSELGHEHANLTIVRGIIGLARGLGLEVIAEGVETEDQAALLRELGCTQAQGFLYAPPLALDELLRNRLRSVPGHDVRH